MGEQIPEKLCGRPLSAADVETIRREIRLANPPIRSEIARRVCRALEWTNKREGGQFSHHCICPRTMRPTVAKCTPKYSAISR